MMKTELNTKVNDGAPLNSEDKQRIVTEATRRGLKIKRQSDISGGRIMHNTNLKEPPKQ